MYFFTNINSSKSLQFLLYKNSFNGLSFTLKQFYVFNMQSLFVCLMFGIVFAYLLIFNKNDKQNIIPFRFDKATHVYVLLWWHFIVRDGVGQTVRQEEKDHYLNCTRAEWHFHFKYLLLLAAAAFCGALHDGSRKKLWFHILREFSCVLLSGNGGIQQSSFTRQSRTVGKAGIGGST